MEKIITFKSQVLEDGHLSIPKEVRKSLHLKKGDKFITSIKPILKNSNLKNDPAFTISKWAVDTDIDDLAHQHDHYIYGTSKSK